MTNSSEDDTKTNWKKNHILTQFMTLQTSNITITQNVLKIVHSIYANQIQHIIKQAYIMETFTQHIITTQK